VSDFVVTARIRVKEGMESRFEVAMLEVVALTLAEPGCLQYVA
jgi:quinol monooxygenase YgiN